MQPDVSDYEIRCLREDARLCNDACTIDLCGIALGEGDVCQRDVVQARRECARLVAAES